MKRTRLSALLGLSVATILGLGFTPAAQAGPLTLSISNGATTVTVTDNGAGDADLAVDRVVISGTTLAANFALSANSTVSTGSNFNVAAVDGFSELARSTSLFSTPGASTVTYTVRSSQTDFTIPLLNPKQASEVHTGSFFNAAGSSIDFNGFVDQPNVLFGTTTLITPDTPVVTATSNALQPFAFSGGPTTFSDDIFALTSTSTIVLTGNGEAQSQSRIVVTAIPEPASLAMAGLGLVGLAGVGIRRRRRAA